MQMKENQPTLCKKRIFSDSYGQLKKINQENAPLFRRVLEQMNELSQEQQQQQQQSHHTLQNNENKIKQLNCAKQQNNIQTTFSKASTTRRIFDQFQSKQFENTGRLLEQDSSVKKNQIFGLKSDRGIPSAALPCLSKRLVGIAQNHQTQQSYQNQGDVQCNYEEEDIMDEFNQLLKKKQPPTLEVAVKITNQLRVFETIVQFLTFEDLLTIKYVCKSFFSHRFQQKIKKKLFHFISENYTLIPSPSDSEILKDLDRTNLGDQETFDGKKKEKLKKVLRAISHNAKDVGYIQGLNQIVGSLLVHNLKENDIYWIVLYFLKKLKLKEMYKEGFPRLKILTFQLEIFMQNYMPDLLVYLKQNQISVSYFCTKWFITLFSYDLNNSTLMKVWNLFLIKGWKVLVRIALGLLKLFEQDIMKEPIDNLSNYIRNFAEQNISDINPKQLIETSFSLKVTNRLLFSLQNIFEQHQVYNCSVFNMNIILFQNRNLNNAFDWKILPQAPDFEGQNSTLEKLNAHTMVTDYINELSTMQMQRQVLKHKRSSSITEIQQPIKGVKVLNAKPNHQRSLSSTRAQNIPLNQFDFPLVQTNYQNMQNTHYFNRSNKILGLNSQDQLEMERKSQVMNKTEGEELGLFQQIQNKIISIFNDDGDDQTEGFTQKQFGRASKAGKDLKQIQLLYNKPQFIRQSSTPQVFQRNPTQTKYYDQVLEDYQEIKEESKIQQSPIIERPIKSCEGPQITKQFNTVMTDINEFDSYLKPQQNNAKYVIIKKPSHIERLNLNQNIKQFQSNQPPPLLTTFQIPQVQQQIFDRTLSYIQPHSTTTTTTTTTVVQSNRQSDLRTYNVQHYQQNNLIPRPTNFQRITPINQFPIQTKGWTIINPRN